MKKIKSGQELILMCGGDAVRALKEFKADREAGAEILLAYIAGRDPAAAKVFAGALI
jgi:hypothetical protein